MKVKLIAVCLALAALVCLAVSVGAADSPKKATSVKKLGKMEVNHRQTVRLEMPLKKVSVKAKALTGKQGGEDISTATAIPDMGWGGTYHASGTTSGYQHDYDEACPSAEALPDVVYSYSVGALPQVIDIMTCGSDYQTKIFVYETDETNVVDCNTVDYSVCGEDLMGSAITNLLLKANTTYYIVIDGYFGGEGPYVLDMEASQPVTTMEGHPTLADARNGNVVMGYDYLGADDTTVWFFGSDDDGATWPDEVNGWNSVDGYPHLDFWGKDTIFCGVGTLYNSTSPPIEYILPHPTHTDGWVAGISSGSWQFSNFKSMDIACDDFWADSVDEDGLPWAYGMSVVVGDVPQPGYLGEPMISWNSDADGGYTAGYDWTEDGYTSGSSDVDIDRTDQQAVSVFDTWHPDSAAWGFTIHNVWWPDPFTGGEYDGSWVFFFRDLLPVTENVRNPAIARWDGHMVIVMEYYTDDGRGESDRDLICMVGNVSPDSLELVGTIVGTDGDETFPQIQHVENQTYLVSFIRNDTLFVMQTSNGGETWSEPCAQYSFLNLDPPQYVYSEGSRRVYDLGNGGIKAAWQYRDYPTTDSSTTFGWGRTSMEYCGGCCIAPVRGDINLSGTPGELGIDIDDLIYLVNYMFKSGPAPECLEEADVTGSGGTPDEVIDIDDLVFLVNYMFKSGPTPPACM